VLVAGGATPLLPTPPSGSRGTRFESAPACRRLAAFVLGGAVALVGAAGDARADSCTAPDLIETMPADQATGVPPNATLFARYKPNAEYLAEPVTIDQFHADAGGDAGPSQVGPTQTLTATFDSTEGMLQATPPAPLTPGDSYVVHWPSLRGIDTATLGTKADPRFTAGTADDVAPPTFAGIASVSWDVSRENDPCTGSIEERYVFHLALGAAADDGGRGSLTLLVFQTSGPGIDASAPSPVLVQRLPPEGQGATIKSKVQVGHVCFAAIVRDLTMKVSTSGAPVCVDTVAPPFFYACDASPGRGSGSVAAIAAALAAFAAMRRASRRRAARGGGEA
jgi:hypothetical protein